MSIKTGPGFVQAADGVNPQDVQQRTLYTGAKMPAIGLGTFGADHASAELIAQAVIGAAAVGLAISIAPRFTATRIELAKLSRLCSARVCGARKSGSLPSSGTTSTPNRM